MVKQRKEDKETMGEDITADKPRGETKKSLLRETIETILIAGLLALIIRTYIVQPFKIPSGSMQQTLQIGDHILVNKFIYRFSNIERGDIVVFKYPKDEKRDFIKRAIAVEGDKVEIRDRAVYVNDQPTNPPYVYHDEGYLQDEYYHPRDNFGPITVPEDKVFVMGDNRENSLDSRYWGFLDIDKIKGKAFIIYWSWNNDDNSVRWGRTGKLLH